MIYDDGKIVVDLNDVSHIERKSQGITVVTKHTTWNSELDFYDNSVWIDSSGSEAFIEQYKKFKAHQSITSVTADVSPALTPEDIKRLETELDPLADVKNDVAVIRTILEFLREWVVAR